MFYLNLRIFLTKKKKKKKKGKERKIALDRKESGQKNAAELIYVFRVSFSANLHLRLIQWNREVLFFYGSTTFALTTALTFFRQQLLHMWTPIVA